ncbi:hypothetical protein ACFQ34_10375 [Pseudonocardia benzenivorans]|jgi:hypothetical protein|uniref:Uncharacterized protein n=2 Tax=Pseudonocardia TaxID=1847 RepID=F4CVM3_PSEUX|nr:hypothetical protein [Pseudonocardia dioxanivorans]AEA24198.1 hypothetical protein Psed_1968 [Pseudonocardia dioxanivorans CB1190]GJF07356.1 hypothetical protein PSD17_63030 [Pseudonocardia sp. D17]
MTGPRDQERPVPPVLVVLAWLWVAVPFAYGLWQLLIKLPALFGG